MIFPLKLEILNKYIPFDTCPNSMELVVVKSNF